ncbi:MAG: LamG domain-containing protein [Bacteroidales bacterium]|nr:LamG domain-containing protein [Bacteroidales bacterium]
MKKGLNFIICLAFPIFLFAQGNSGSVNLINNSYVSTSAVGLECEDDFTIMGWMKLNTDYSTGDSWFDVVEMNDRGEDNYRHFWIQKNPNNSTLQFALQLDLNSESSLSESSIQEGEWFHFAATCNGHNQKLYINGVEESGLIGTVNNSSSFVSDFSLSLGSFAAWFFADDFDGQVDRVSVWESALSQEEICSLMNDKELSTGHKLVAYFSNDKVDEVILKDNDMYSFENLYSKKE